MNKLVKLGLISVLSISLLTGCGCDKKDTDKGNNNDNNDVVENNQNQSVVEDQVFEGLEFVNVGASDGVVSTIVINNTGVTYEGSKFSMKIMDSTGNVIVELVDEVDVQMETGTTHRVETKTDADLSKAVSIEYSIVQ